MVRRQKNKSKFQWTDCWFLVLSIRNLEVTVLENQQLVLDPDESKGHTEHCSPPTHPPSTGETNKQPSREVLAGTGKPEQQLLEAQCWQLWELRTPMGSSCRGAPQGCEIYQQKPHRKIREKSPWASGRRRGEKESFWNTPVHFALHKVCPQEKLVNQSLTR